MISLKVKRKTKNLNKLINKVKKLSGKSIKSGYFSDQGKHPTAGINYADLAYLHAKGTDMFPPRDIRLDALEDLKGYNFTPLLNKYLYKKMPLDSVLDTFAFRLEDTAQSKFGVPSINNPDNSKWWSDQKEVGNAPLLQFGYLRDAWESRVVNVGES